MVLESEATMKVGDLVCYDNRIGLLVNITDEHVDNVSYIILIAGEGFYNLGKYQKRCIEVISESR